MQMKQHPPQIKKTLAPRLALPFPGLTRYGVALKIKLAKPWKEREGVVNLLSNGPVEKPVRSGGHGKALGASFEREDLAGDTMKDICVS